MAQNEASLLIRIKQVGGEILDKLQDGLGFVAEKAMYVGTALVGLGTLAINSFRDAEKASNELSQSMVNQGVYTVELKQKYDDMAAALQRTTTYADEQITSAQATLQSFVGQREVTEDLVKATMNLATAKGMDLKSAAELVGKTIGTETNALARQGIEIDATADKTKRLEAVVGALNAKFGGQAEAAAMGLGKLEQLKNVADDFAEAIGGRLAPYVAYFTQALSKFTVELTTNKSAMDGIGAVIDFLAKGFVYLKNAIVGTVEVISTGLAASVETVSALMDREWTKAKDIAAMGMDSMGTLIKDRKAILNEELNAMDQQQAITEELKRQEELNRIAQSEANKTQVAAAETAKRTEIMKKAADERAKKEAEETAKINAQQKIREQDQRSTLSTIASMQGENNKLLAATGKAAALTQLAIDTPVAVGKALSAFPPPFNFAAAGAVAAAMAAQAARVAGVKLAEGGIVKATPGGVPAIIGEGGRDEAVIPLDDPSTADRLGGGKGTTIIFSGPVLGDEAQAMEFARAIDRNLLKLRQSNQSVAFDTDVF
jgi:hypothetical protein